MKCLAAAVAMGALAIAGCGENDSTDSTTSVSVKLKQQMPLGPVFFEGSSTGISFADANGDEVYNEDFWKLPDGRPNETMDTINYDLDEVTLATPGEYKIDAVIRACDGSGCSAEDLGRPVVHCETNPGIDAEMQITVVYKDRKQTPGCGFAIQSP